MKRTRLSLSSALVLLAVLLVAAFAPKASAEETSIFEQNFESAGLVSGSDPVYQATNGFAGVSTSDPAGTISVVENGIQGKSLKAVHTFWEEGGWQKASLYKDNLTMADADKYYTLYFETEVFGSIDYVYFFARGAAGDNNAAAVLNVSENVVEPQGNVKVDFVKEGKLYKIRMSWLGNGGNAKAFFETNLRSTSPADANQNLDSGYYIDNFKFSSDDKVASMDGLAVPTNGYTRLWSTDFNDAEPTTVGSDAMYQVNGFAGLGATGLTFDATGFNGTQALKGTYSFFDNGWQQSTIYQTAYLWGSYWSNAYRLSFSFKPFGQVDQGDIYLRFDGNEPYPYSAIMNYNVARGRIFLSSFNAESILGMDYSHVDGVFTVNLYMRGCDSGYFIEYLAHTGTPASANELNDSGLLIDDFSLYQCDNYELDKTQEKVIFAEDFNNTNSSIAGSDAMYQANGFAGPSGLSIEENGIDGKSLKVIHDFWSTADGGWQKANMYQTARLEGTKDANLYELSVDIKLLGNIAHSYFKLLTNNVAIASVMLYTNGTYQFDAGECDKTKVQDILVSYDNTTQVFHLSYKFFGTNGNLMFIDYMHAADADTSNTNQDTGFLLDNFKLAAIAKRSASEGVQGTYKTVYEENFNELVAGTTYATGDALYQATGFAGPADGESTTREIIADGINGNSLKVTYSFYDNNCSIGSLYLDCNKGGFGSTQIYDIYKFEMNVKPLGDVDTEIYKNMGNWVGITLAGATWGPDLANFIYSEVTKTGDVYHYVAYLYGNGGALSDTFEVHIIPGSSAPTGIILDDYSVSIKVSDEIPSHDPEEPIVIDYTPTISDAKYELGDNVNVEFTVNLKDQALTLVKIGDRELTNSEYSVNGNKLSVNYAVLEELDPGKYIVTITTVETASSELIITNLNVQVSGNYTDRYAQNFDDLEAKSYTGDEMFHINGFAGITTQVVEDGINNKSVKAVYNFWPVADGGWQNGNLYIDSSKTRAADINTVYRVSFKLKPFGSYAMVAFCIQFDETAQNPNSVIYLKSDGTYSNEPNSLLIKYDVTFENGVFTVNAYYKSAGYFLFNYWHMQRTDDNVETGFYLDDYSFATVKSPALVSDANVLYDVVTEALPSFELDLAGFDVANVKANGALLTKDTDYTLETLTSGNVKLTLTKAYMDTKSIGDVVNVTVKTTKSTMIEGSVTVVNAVPVFEESDFVYQLDSNKDVLLTVDLKDVAISSIKIDDTVLDASKYSIEGNKLTISSSVFEALEKGSYVLTLTTGDSAKVNFTVSDADRIIKGTYSALYTQDFEGLELGKYTSDSLYHACGFAGLGDEEPGAHEIVDGKLLKSTYKFWPVSEGGWQKEGVYLNSGYTLAKNTELIYRTSFQVSAFGAWDQVCYGVQLADSGIPNNWIHLYSNGTYSFENYNDYLVKAEVEYLNGTFTVTVYYRSAGYYLFSFFNLQRNDDAVETGLLLDNFCFAKMDVPELVSAKGTYDQAVSENPYYLIDMYGYEITSVKLGETTLTKDTDYTYESVFGSTRIRLELTNSFVSAHQVGTNETIYILTTKGNTIELSFAVVNTTPAVTAETAIDVAENRNVEVAIDLKGQTLEKLSLNNTDLAGNEYTINNENTTLTFKKEYLAKLALGENVFTLTSSSGASQTFKLVISNSTPEVADGTYQKGSNANVELTVDLKGKDITKVMVDETELSANQYSVANGKLSINASVFEALAVGNHTVKVATLGEASATVAVSDVNPEITGEYNPTMGEALVITVNLHDRSITEVKVDAFVLMSDEYSYADGELTINASVLEELAAGSHTVKVTTNGGSAEVAFTLKAGTTPVDPENPTTAPENPTTAPDKPTTTSEQGGETTTSKKKGCKGELGLTLLPLAIISLTSILVVRKRREE